MRPLYPIDPMNSHTAGWLVWAYVPNADLDGWQPPYVCQPSLGEVDGDVFYCAADAHRVAQTLRSVYHGHLFGVVHTSKLPKLAAGPQLPSFV